MKSRSVTSTIWKTEADSAISAERHQHAREQLGGFIAHQLIGMAHKGASGPFALWTRTQLLCMSKDELTAAVIPHISTASVQMFLAGQHVAFLKERKLMTARKWTESYFTDLDIPPDTTFTVLNLSPKSVSDPESVRAVYCAVFCEDVIWRLNQNMAA